MAGGNTSANFIDMLNHYNNELSLQNINPNTGISVHVYSPNRAV